MRTSAGFHFYRVPEPSPPIPEEQLHILHSIQFYKLTTVWSAIPFKIAHRPIWSVSGGLLSLSLRKGCFLKGSVVKTPSFTPSLARDGVPAFCLVHHQTWNCGSVPHWSAHSFRRVQPYHVLTQTISY